MPAPSMVAVILGGGRGTRLYPLTKDRSKPAVPLAGKYRLIDIPISNAINSGIRQIYVLSQFNSASLNNHVSSAYRFDQFSRGFVQILAAEQTETSGEWFQGTADAVRQSYNHLSDNPADYVLILSGDHLYTMDYTQFLAHHQETGAEISVAVQPATAQVAPELGLLKTDQSGRILDFVEKPANDELASHAVDTAALGLSSQEAQLRPFLGSMGIYLFNWDVLDEILRTDTTALDFGREVIPRNMAERHIQAYLFTGYWADIGTVSAFFEANLLFCDALPPFNLFDPDHPVYTNARFLPPAKVRGGHFEDCIVSEGCIIEGGTFHRSLLGVRSRILDGVDLHETVLLGADYYEAEGAAPRNVPRMGIGENTVVRRAIIDKDARIGSNVRLTNENQVEHYQDPDGRLVVRDGIIVVPKNAVVPDEFAF